MNQFEPLASQPATPSASPGTAPAKAPPPVPDIKVPEELKELGGKLKKGLFRAFSDGVSALDKATAGTQARTKGEQFVRGARRPGAWKELLSPPNTNAPLPIQEMKDAVAAAIADEQLNSRLRARIEAYVATKAAAGAAASNGSAEMLHAAIKDYVQRVPVLIELASAGAAATGQAAKLAPVLQLASRMFLAKDDLIPEREGLYGLIDNTYLAVGVLDAASAEHAKRTTKPLFDVNLSAANGAVRELLGAEQAAALDAKMGEIKDHEAFKTAVKGVAIAVGVAVAAILVAGALDGDSAAGRTLVRGAARKLGGGALGDATGGPGSWGACTEDEIARLSAQIGLST